MRPALLLHLGFHKTGTTWLQQNFFLAHPHILHLGKAFPFPEPDLVDVLRDLIFRPQTSFRPDSAGRAIEQLVERNLRAASAREVVSISEERLSTGSDWFGSHSLSMLDRLGRTLDDRFELRVLIGIRNQPEIVPSFYSEYVRSGGTCSLERLLTSPYSSGRYLLSHFRFSPFLERARTVFGPERILVYLLEDLRANPDLLARRIERFANVPHATIDTDARPRRARLSATALGLTRALNTCFFSKLNNNGHLVPASPLLRHLGDLIASLPFDPLELRRRIADLPAMRREQLIANKVRAVLVHWLAEIVGSVGGARGGRYELPAHLEEEVRDFYRADNRRVEELLEMDLAPHGYPI